MKKKLVGVITSLLLTGCSSLSGFGTDNHPKPAPLASITPAIQVKSVWSATAGNGAANMQIALPLAADGDVLYASNFDGTVAAFKANNGKRLWSTQTKANLTSGPGVGDGLVVIGSSDGRVIALDQVTGKLRWQHTVSTQIMAAPAIAANKVIVKTIDGTLYALNAADGSQLWQYVHTSSQYMLRASSMPQIAQDRVVVGFNDGKLLAVKLDNGQLLWERTIAIPQGASLVQQLVGIDTNPLIVNQTIYVATYQGNLLAMSFDGSQLLWQQPFSTYNDLAQAGNQLLATNTDSHVWSVNRQTGRIDWRQTQLAARDITAPVIQQQTVVVGDKEGYLHWLALDDGHILARAKVGSDPIMAKPITVDNTLVVVTQSGKLVAYRVV